MTIIPPVDAEEREVRRRARDAARKRRARAAARANREAGDDGRRPRRRRGLLVACCVAGLLAVGSVAPSVTAPARDETATRLGALLTGFSELETRLADRLEVSAVVPAVSLTPVADRALLAVGEDSAAAAANSAATLNALGAVRRETAATARASSALVEAVEQLRTEVAELRSAPATAPLPPPGTTADLEPVPLVPVPADAPVIGDDAGPGDGGPPSYEFTVEAGESLLATLERACGQADECDAVVLGTEAVWRAGVTQTVRLTWDAFLGRLVQGFPAARAQPWIVVHDNRVIELRDRM